MKRKVKGAIYVFAGNVFLGLWARSVGTSSDCKLRAQWVFSKLEYLRTSPKLVHFEGLKRISEVNAVQRKPSVRLQWSQCLEAGMKWMRKPYAHQWHEGHKEHKAAGSQMAEGINA